MHRGAPPPAYGVHESYAHKRRLDEGRPPSSSGGGAKRSVHGNFDGKGGGGGGGLSLIHI